MIKESNKILNIIENHTNIIIDKSKNLYENINNDTLYNEILQLLINDYKLNKVAISSILKKPILLFIDYIINYYNKLLTPQMQQYYLWLDKLVDIKIYYKLLNNFEYFKYFEIENNNTINDITNYLIDIDINIKIYDIKDFYNYIAEIIIDFYQKKKKPLTNKLLNYKNNQYIEKNIDTHLINNDVTKYIYDDYWNWCRQDIMNINKYDVLNEKYLYIKILNKLDNFCENYFNFYSQKKKFLENIRNNIKVISNNLPKYKFFDQSLIPNLNLEKNGYLNYKEIIRNNNYKEYFDSFKNHIEIYDIKNKKNNFNDIYKNIIINILDNGLEYYNKNIIIIDLIYNKITVELLKSFLMCGSNIILITENISINLKKIYQKYGSKNSKLIIFKKKIIEKNIKSILKNCLDEYDKNIDLIIPLFKQKEETNQANYDCYIPVNILLFFEELYNNYNNTFGKYILCIIPFIPNMTNLFNSKCYSLDNEYFNNILIRYSEKFKKNFIFVGINTGIVRDNYRLKEQINYENLENNNIFTFSANELTLYFIGLLNIDMLNIYSNSLLLLDLSNNLYKTTNLVNIINEFEKNIIVSAKYNIYIDKISKNKFINDIDSKYFEPRHNINSFFPNIPNFDNEKTDKLPLDYKSIIVIVGYGENSFFGNCRTRLNIENNGYLSIESCIELSWYMGLIEYNDTSWIDKESNEEITEYDIYLKYEKKINKIMNIQLNKYPENSENTNIYKSCILKHDINITINSIEEETFLKNKYSDNIIIKKNNDKKYGILKKNTEILITCSISKIPKNINNYKIYGIPENIINDIDELSLYTIVAAAEALISSGISDPYEIYQYISSTDLGNVIGVGIRDNFNNNINDSNKGNIIKTTISYWLNKVLLNSNGPTKIPDCGNNAFAMSIEMGIDILEQNKAELVFVGSSDKNSIKKKDTEFLNQTFQQYSSSILIITTAKFALNIGLPIYGICAYVNSALKLKELSELVIDYNEKDIDNSLTNYENRKKMLNNIKSHIKNTTNDDFINYLNKYFGHDFYKNDKKISHLIGALSVWNLTIDDIMLGVYNNFFYDNNIKDSTIIQKQLQYLGRNNGNLLPIIFPSHNLYSNSCSFGFLINSLLNSFQTNIVKINNDIDNIDSNIKNNNLLYYPNKDIEFNSLKSILLKNISEDNNTCVELLLIHPNYLISNLKKKEYLEYNKKFKKRKYLNFRIWDYVLFNKRNLIHFKKNTVFSENTSYLNTLILPNYTLNNDITLNNDVQDIKNFTYPINYDLNLNSIELAEIFQIYSKQMNNSSCKGIGIEIKTINYNIFMENKDKVFTKNEICYCEKYNDKDFKFSCIYTAKESILKALNNMINLHDNFDDNLNSFCNYSDLNSIEISFNNTNNVRLSGKFQKIIEKSQVNNITLLTSYTKNNSYALTMLY